jgi:hypothetical protein
LRGLDANQLVTRTPVKEYVPIDLSRHLVGGDKPREVQLHFYWDRDHIDPRYPLAIDLSIGDFARQSLGGCVPINVPPSILTT